MSVINLGAAGGGLAEAVILQCLHHHILVVEAHQWVLPPRVLKPHHRRHIAAHRHVAILQPLTASSLAAVYKAMGTAIRKTCPACPTCSKCPFFFIDFKLTRWGRSGKVPRCGRGGGG